MKLRETIQHVLNATKYSYDGLTVIWEQQLSFRIEVYTILFLLPIIFYLPICGFMKLLLCMLALLVILVETLNSSIEATIDRISCEHHALSKIAKDLGSTAVFIALMMNLISWVYVLFNIGAWHRC